MQQFMINIGDIRESRLRRKVSVSRTIWNEKRRSILRYFVTRILALALVQRNINQTLFETHDFCSKCGST